MSEMDYNKLRRWLLGLAEAQVTASGSRATFVSDMYFDAAEAIDKLLSENQDLKRQLEERSDTASPESKSQPDTNIQELIEAVEQALSEQNRLVSGHLVLDDAEEVALRSALLKIKGGA